MIFDKGATTIQWKKIAFSINGAGSPRGHHEEGKLVHSYVNVLSSIPNGLRTSTQNQTH